jgi:hypothetical protein
MIKHPTLSPQEIEELQRWCFEEDFQRLGPTIFRVLEACWLGYERLRNSVHSALRAKARFFAQELRAAYPAFLVGRLLGPNCRVRRAIGDLQRTVQAELGPPRVGERCKAVLALGAALWTGLTSKLGLFQHPRLTRTRYRIPSRS